MIKAAQFNHIAPGKYLLLTRPAPTAQRALIIVSAICDRRDARSCVSTCIGVFHRDMNGPNDDRVRATLRREAEAAKKEIDLVSCKPVTSYVLTP